MFFRAMLAAAPPPFDVAQGVLSVPKHASRPAA